MNSNIIMLMHDATTKIWQCSDHKCMDTSFLLISLMDYTLKITSFNIQIMAGLEPFASFLAIYLLGECILVYEIQYTVNSAYNGSTYKELSVIENWFSFPDLYPSLFYVKKYGYSGSGYKELSLRTNSFSGPNAYKSMQIRLLLVKFAPRRLITR